MMLLNGFEVCFYYYKNISIEIIILILEYQLSKETSQEYKLTISDVFNDNLDEDKYRSTLYERLIPGKFSYSK